jgi:hypothetical protein
MINYDDNYDGYNDNDKNKNKNKNKNENEKKKKKGQDLYYILYYR